MVGRKILGALVNTSKNLALKFNTFSKTDDSTAKKEHNSISLCFSMKNHLRDEVIESEIEFNEKLPREEFLQAKHKPNLIVANFTNK